MSEMHEYYNNEAKRTREILWSVLKYYSWLWKARLELYWEGLKLEWNNLVQSTRAWAISASLGWAVAVGTHLGYAYVVLR